MKGRIAIIGAGPSGLAQLRAFETARRKGHEVPELVCYEKQSDLGGLWNYTWRTGQDENGEPVHGSMYRYLWSNGPKECLEFADYSFEEHFGRAIPSYPPRAVLRDYIMGRVDNHDLRKYIRFSTPVRWVEYNEDDQQFTVSALDHNTHQMTMEKFDYVIVASGHFSTPNTPYFEGFNAFPGRILHAHEFRDACEFTGQHVLMIGSSYSAEDIGSQCYKYGAASVTFSSRSGPMGYDWPETMHEVPLLQRLEGKTAYFADGSSEDVDAVVLCTGYLHHFPFLPDALRLQTRNRLYAANLYKGIFFEGNRKLMYLGMQDQYYTFNMFDAQAWYARDVVLGRIPLPDEGAMVEDQKQWLLREEALETATQEIDFQTAYIRDLLGETDYEFAVEEQGELFKQWKKHKYEDIMGYRNKSYPSTVTGNVGTPLSDRWLELRDDSLETFMTSTLLESQSEDAAGGAQ